MARTRKPPAKKATKRPTVPKTGFLGKVMGAIGGFMVKVLRPFRFLLHPFKSRPVRFVGRILAKVFLINYFRASWQEVRQVTWPDRKQTIQLTFAVFVFAISFGVLVAIVDFGLDKLFREVLL